MRRKLYWSPRAWRTSMGLALLAAIVLGIALAMPTAFWAVALFLVFVNMFVRQSLKLELGICGRHRKLRRFLIGLSWTCILGVFVGVLFMTAGMLGTVILLVSLAMLLALAVFQSFIGVQAVRLKELSPEHAWLSGTGELFRSELPELN